MRTVRCRPFARVLAVGLGLLAAAACSTSSASGAAPLVDDRSTEQLIADFHLADGAVLRFEDLPPGWKVEIPRKGADADRRLMACLGIEDTSVVLNDGGTDTEQLAAGDARVISTVTVYPTVEYAAEAFAPVHLPAFAGCYEAGLEAELEAMAPLAPSVAAEVHVEPADLGDEAAVLRAELVIAGEGLEHRTFLELTSVRIGRAVTSLALTNVAAPFDPALGQPLLDTSLVRLAAVAD